MNLMFLYFGICIGISFLCSILEAIILSLTMSHINIIIKKNKKAGNMLKSLKERMDTSLASILTLNTIANVVGAAGVGAESVRLFGEEYMFYFSFGLTITILYFSEIIPKTIGSTYWKQLAIPAGYVIKVFIFITFPLVYIAKFITNFIQSKSNVHSVTREDILINTQMGEKSGSIGERESDFIENILVNKYKVYDILTPRTVVFSLKKNMKIREAIKQEDIKKFSRIPIYNENIDDIIGVVLSKNMFKKALEDQEVDLEHISKSIYSVNQNIPILKALNLFIKKKEHMFLVTDNYGQTSGIVTLEDCIEALLGVEIMDESDTTEDMQELAKLRMKKKRNSKQLVQP